VKHWLLYKDNAMAKAVKCTRIYEIKQINFR